MLISLAILVPVETYVLWVGITSWKKAHHE